MLLATAKVTSLRQLWDSAALAETIATQTFASIICRAIVSGHSSPGCTPLSYHTR